MTNPTHADAATTLRRAAELLRDSFAPENLEVAMRLDALSEGATPETAMEYARIWLRAHSEASESSEDVLNCAADYDLYRTHPTFRALADSPPEGTPPSETEREALAKIVEGKVCFKMTWPTDGIGRRTGEVHTDANCAEIADAILAAGYRRVAPSASPETPRPEIVCLCGSTRFMDTFFEEGWRLTLEGKIVLSVGVVKTAEHHAAEALGQDVADRLDELHLRKIDLADRVLILNVGGYIGHSTRRELDYALAHGKPVEYLEPLAARTGDETP